MLFALRRCVNVVHGFSDESRVKQETGLIQISTSKRLLQKQQQQLKFQATKLQLQRKIGEVILKWGLTAPPQPLDPLKSAPQRIQHEPGPKRRQGEAR